MDWFREIDWYPSKLYKNLNTPPETQDQEKLMQKLRDEIGSTIDHSLTISIIDHK